MQSVTNRHLLSGVLYLLIPMPLIDTVIMMADVVGNGFVESSFYNRRFWVLGGHISGAHGIVTKTLTEQIMKRLFLFVLFLNIVGIVPAQRLYPLLRTAGTSMWINIPICTKWLSNMISYYHVAKKGTFAIIWEDYAIGPLRTDLYLIPKTTLYW